MTEEAVIITVVFTVVFTTIFILLYPRDREWGENPK